MIRDQRRQADAQIDVRTLRNVARDAGRHLIAAEARHRQRRDDTARARRGFGASGIHAALLLTRSGTSTTRCTKTPGVTIASGSSSPNSTFSRTCAIVHRAALAMI